MKKIFMALLLVIIFMTLVCIFQKPVGDPEIPPVEKVLLVSPPTYSVSEILYLPEPIPMSVPTPKVNPCIIDGSIVHASLEDYEDGYIYIRCEEFIEKRYGFSYNEIYLLAQLLCGDKNVDGDGEYDFDFGNSERYDQISLVLSVVMNRVRSDEFPDTVTDVVTAKRQFSVMPRNLNVEPSEIALLRVTEWCEAYDRWDGGVQSVPEDHLYFTGDGLENHSSISW